jgi:hypothetical protein
VRLSGAGIPAGVSILVFYQVFKILSPWLQGGSQVPLRYASGPGEILQNRKREQFY